MANPIRAETTKLGLQQEAPLDRPVLNGPRDAPSHHFVIGPKGPTDEIVHGRPP